MDTLFRLVSLHSSDQQPPQPQQSSYNSSRTNSSSSRSTTEYQPHYYNQYYTNSSSYTPQPNTYYHYQQQHYQDQDQIQEECCTNNHLYMDEDFSSSSSSKHFHQHHGGSSSGNRGGATHHHNPHSSTNTPTTTPIFDPFPPTSNFSPFPQDLNLDFSSPSSSSATTSGGTGGGRWASQLLLECARAIAARDSQRAQQLMWMLNELSSAYGDTDQKIAAYFLQGLFARMTTSGPRTSQTLSEASDRNCSFESTRETALRFQELSPWSSFGHVAANGAILEAFLESSSSSSSQQSLHILDFSNTFCTQWPTLLEALATRSSDDTPHLSITTVVSSTSPSSSVQRVMKEIGQRMEKFARLMGVPFKFNIIHHSGDLSELDLDSLDLGGSGTALAINCINSLRSVSQVGHRRESFINSLHRLHPRIVTIIEEEADLEAGDGTMDEDGDSFLKRFSESLRFFSAYMESLEESFPRTSNERLVLERSAGRAIVDLIACPASESVERRDTAVGWSRRIREAGFSMAAFSEDVSDDVRALLRRYRDGWSMQAEDSEDSGGPGGVFLAWKGMPMVWASAWRP